MTRATLRTSEGAVALELFDEDAPRTVDNFRSLAGDGFYVEPPVIERVELDD